MNGTKTVLARNLTGAHCGSSFVHNKRRYTLTGVYPSTSGDHVRLTLRRGSTPAQLVFLPDTEIVIEP